MNPTDYFYYFPNILNFFVSLLFMMNFIKTNCVKYKKIDKYKTIIQETIPMI